METINILIIDDHPQIAESYKSALAKISKTDNNYNFDITEVATIDKAYHLIANIENIKFDLIFLDIKLPKSNDGEFLSGEDLGIEIRKISPESKIIVATTYNDNFRVTNIFKSINPDGFLIKNDLTKKALVNAVESILDGAPAYSKSVNRILRKIITNDISLDKFDRLILYELSQGTKMGELPNIVNLSIGTIERRKRQLKEAFDVSKKDDKALINVAREKGFI